MVEERGSATLPGVKMLHICCRIHQPIVLLSIEFTLALQHQWNSSTRVACSVRAEGWRSTVCWFQNIKELDVPPCPSFSLLISSELSPALDLVCLLLSIILFLIYSFFFQPHQHVASSIWVSLSWYLLRRLGQPPYAFSCTIDCTHCCWCSLTNISTHETTMLARQNLSLQPHFDPLAISCYHW